MNTGLSGVSIVVGVAPDLLVCTRGIVLGFEGWRCRERMWGVIR
jgi:hypothetical protein